MILSFVAVCALAVLCCIVGYGVVRQQGRLLIRLDGIEQELTVRRLQERSRGTLIEDSAPLPTPNEASTEHAFRAADEFAPSADPILAKTRINRSGLQIGTQAPDFTLEEIGTGRRRSLADWRRRPVLLVLGSIDCAPCDQLFAALGDASFERLHPFLVFVIRGAVDEVLRKSRSNAPSFAVLHQPDWNICRLYGTFKFPSAYLLDQDGLISAGPAYGPSDIIDLARQLVTAESRAHEMTLG